jgi:hypothetical protein
VARSELGDDVQVALLRAASGCDAFQVVRAVKRFIILNQIIEGLRIEKIAKGAFATQNPRDPFERFGWALLEIADINNVLFLE